MGRWKVEGGHVGRWKVAQVGRWRAMTRLALVYRDGPSELERQLRPLRRLPAAALDGPLLGPDDAALARAAEAHQGVDHAARRRADLPGGSSQERLLPRGRRALGAHARRSEADDDAARAVDKLLERVEVLEQHDLQP